jgi:hypothetical protein
MQKPIRLLGHGVLGPLVPYLACLEPTNSSMRSMTSSAASGHARRCLQAEGGDDVPGVATAALVDED